MIAPEFRSCHQIQMMGPIQNFVSFNYGKPELFPYETYSDSNANELYVLSGDGLWTDLQNEIASAEQTYN